MKKYICLLMALMLIFTCISCEEPQKAVKEEETATRAIVDVTLSATQPKVLNSSVNNDIMYWEFRATPKFELHDDEKIYGAVSYWRTLPALNTVQDGVSEVKTATSLGRYTSGDWLFELRALNSLKHVIAVGKTQLVLREGKENIVNIDMFIDNASDEQKGNSKDISSRETGWDGHTDSSKTTTTVEKGTLHVGLVANRMDTDISNMKVVTLYQKINEDLRLGSVVTPTISWDDRNGLDGAATGVAGEHYTKWYKEATKTNYQGDSFREDSTDVVEEGKVYYEGILEGLDAGAYVFTFFIQGKDKDGQWINLGGQALDVIIVGGEETLIKGTVLANEYVLAGLKITAPGTIFGSINGKKFIAGTPEKAITLQFQQTEGEKEDSGEVAKMFNWTVGGEKQSATGSTFEFSCPRDESGNPLYGIYRVTCVPVGAQGSTGTTSIDVIFNPETGPNVGEFDWSGVADANP